MSIPQPHRSMKRYKIVAAEKSGGVTYTPKNLADFVARQITQAAHHFPADRPLRVLDPAIGDGELLVSLLENLPDRSQLVVEVHDFETDKMALETATARIKKQFSNVFLRFKANNFLEYVLENFGGSINGNLFRLSVPEAYDLIIANPPYVRTQIMGAFAAQRLARQFGLTGRVDLYHSGRLKPTTNPFSKFTRRISRPGFAWDCSIWRPDRKKKHCRNC